MDKESGNILFVLAGPTGVGKTRRAIELAEQYNAAIISADSRQVYKEMQIGTAAPTPAERGRVPHHFAGHKSVEDYYNASMYEQEVLAFLQDYFKRRRLAVMAGGSGMYIDAVCHGIAELPEVDTGIREQVKHLWKKQGLSALQQEVQRADPEFYHRADIQNPMRLRRALEVYRQTGRPFSAFRRKAYKVRPFRIVKIGLYLSREEMYQRINKRVDKMLESGLLDEVRGLYKYKYLNALNTVGYKELFAYLDGEIDYAEAVRLIKRNSRRYAKRQITWFKKDKTIEWMYADDGNALKSLMLSIVNRV